MSSKGLVSRCFKHETKKLLVRFRFQDDGLSTEAFVKKDFIGWKLLEARVAKDESVDPHSGCV